ncbi:hypothetical protein [Nonomuraea recticatena]|uniref:hypothetical protein n=1 Tax=Nonomuraea recticatena TaxID=46178 RepID=UPI0031F7F5D4
MSVLLASRRPHLAVGALAQIAGQVGVQVEVVLAAHGWADRAAGMVSGAGVPVTVVDVDEAVPYGGVVQAAAGRASGSLVSVWDDDDWYAPTYLAGLLAERQRVGADVVGVTLREWVYAAEHDRTYWRPGLVGWFWHVAGGSITLPRALLAEVGGFPMVGSGVDGLVLARLREMGAGIYRADGRNYLRRRMRPEWHTCQTPTAGWISGAALSWPGVRPGWTVPEEELAQAVQA